MNASTESTAAKVDPIFCFGTWQDAERIMMGQRNPDNLNEAHRYAFKPDGYGIYGRARVVDPGTPDEVIGNFKWCGFGEVTPLTHPNNLQIPGYIGNSFRAEEYVFRIIPRNPAGIYVVNEGSWWKRRTELLESRHPSPSFDESEMHAMNVARAQTFVPLAEYAGNYEMPLVLVKRELGFDEIELVSGPRH